MMLLSLFCALPLCAGDASDFQVETNTATNTVVAELTNPPYSGTTQAAESQPAPVIETVPPVTIHSSPVVETPSKRFEPEPQDRSAAPVIMEPRGAARSDEPYIWFALTGVLVVSVISLMVTWQTSRRTLTAAASMAPRMETPATIAPTLLPVISQAIKEALVQELSAQRRELLTAQQSAATELSQLARRLEAVQTPLLERLVAPRPVALLPAKFSREIPVKIFCSCGQKFAFEVQPVEGRMPFPIACPACGQDGTHQANQLIMRMLNGITQSLPSPGGGWPVNAASAGVTPQLVDAVKQAVVKELAASPSETPKPVPAATTPQHKNGSASQPIQTGNPAEAVLPGLLTKGQALVDAGELDKAVKCLEAALALQPDRTETLLKLGGVLDRLDRADEALQQYDRAIALDESLTIAYLNKGGVFNRLARYDEALRCYEQALLKQKKAAA